jgi:hypothetical protein
VGVDLTFGTEATPPLINHIGFVGLCSVERVPERLLNRKKPYISSIGLEGCLISDPGHNWWRHAGLTSGNDAWADFDDCGQIVGFGWPSVGQI